MINNCSIENNTINHNNEINDNIEKTQIHKESKNILNIIQKSENSIIEYEQLFSLSQNENNITNENTYFLINKGWLKKFRSFCNSNDLFSQYILPGTINNEYLIIQDDSVLKIKNEQLYYFDKRKDFDNCLFIKKDIWEKLFALYGGGPQYKIICFNDKYNNIIKDGGHINLLFIPNKKYIKNNNDDFIISKYIYFDLNKKVIDLKCYVNKILNTHKKKFSIKNKENIEENKHYRLWIYSSFIGLTKDLVNYLIRQINYFVDDDLIDCSKFQNLNENKKYKMILLSNFDDNYVKDIFPNEHTNFFNWKEYNSLKSKKKDRYLLPEFTLIIEQMPKLFMLDNISYKIGICNKCNFGEIIGCFCKCKQFYLCNYCQKNKTKEINNHNSKCKAYLMEYYDLKNNELSRNKNLVFSLIGLLNLGNTCYMNSALQCMRSIRELTNYLIYYFDESQINIKNKIGTGGFLTKAYINFIYNLNNCQKEYYSPEYFKNTIGIIDDRYSGYEQQDTHEFMTFLIDSIHEDLNKVINKPIINRKESENATYYSQGLDDKKSTIEWNNFLKRNQSIMIDLFYGQYKATISCTFCHHKSINFSTYLSLQLPIPKSKEYIFVKILFLENWLYKYPYLKFGIIMTKQNKKISVAKSIISEILDIDSDELEMIQMKSQEIIEIYRDEDEIDEKVNFYVAVKTNKSTTENNLICPKVVDYDKFKKKVNNEKEEIIKIFENNSIDDNYDIDIDFGSFKDNNTKNGMYLDKIIIKHYYLSNNEISGDILFKDNLFYFQLNKSCYDIYYKIYEIFFEIIVKENLGEFNDDEQKKLLFENYFINFLDNENEFTNNIFEKYEYIPFVLKFYDNKNKKNIFIPPLREYIFKNFINHNNKNNNQNENKNNIIINNIVSNIPKQKENIIINNKALNEIQQKENNSLIVYNNLENNMNINNTQEINDDKIGNNIEIDAFQYNNNINHINARRSNYDPVNNNPIKSKSNTEKTNNTNSKNDKNVLINITKDNEDDKIDELKKTIKIIIIWNPKYLKKDIIKNKYYLLTKTSEEIELQNYFQDIYENHFKKISINKCFEEFSKEETFDKDNLWKCSKCNKNIAAKNKIEIYQTPKILIIQLKRFENNQKIESFVDFPLKDLDISQFTCTNSKINNDVPKKYDLFAVANHYGRLEYGHYDAFCLNYIDNNWYNFNDRFVDKIKKEEENNTIVSKNAYVLFYRQQKNELINWDKIYTKKFCEINNKNMKKYGEDFIYKNISNKNNIQNIKNLKNVKNEVNDEIFNLDELSLGSFVYNPFKKNYLKMKRNLEKEDISTK